MRDTPNSPAAAQAQTPLGILAGGGGLPIEIAAAARAAGRPVHIVAIDGFAGPQVADFPHSRVNLGQAGAMLASLRRAGCREMVIAGSLERPNLLRLRFDLGALQRWRVLMSLTRGGDDSVLRRIVRFFEGEGFRVVGAAEVAPGLIATLGPFGRVKPDAAQTAAIVRAARLIAALGPFDVGQGVVATADRIVAVEGVRGTDGMLRDLDGTGPESGAVLVKLAKPGQEMRIDLPTIGPATIARADAACLTGIAVGAGAAIVLDRTETVAAADRAGLFLTGIEPPATKEPGAADAAPSPEPPAVEALLSVLARRAPTPADRRDIAVARRLLPVLRTHGAGRATVIGREHVRAVVAGLAVDRAVAALGRDASWGRRAFRREIGILALDIGSDRPGEVVAEALPGIEVFRAALAAGLAGVVCLGAPIPEERLRDLAPWANEARVFLMGENPPLVEPPRPRWW